jgi:hypothetical protein
MLGWFRRKTNSPSLRVWSLPGEIGTVSLPDGMKVELEDDDSTLLAHWLPADDVNIRVSSISFETRDGRDEEAAKTQVRRSAKEHGNEYKVIGGKGVEVEREIATEEEGVRLVLKRWIVGMKNTVTIMTVTLREDCRRSALVKTTLDAMPKIIESVNIKWVHRTVEAEGQKVLTRRSSAEATPEQVAEFRERDRKWLESAEVTARKLSVKYGSGGDFDPEELDRVFSRWMADDGQKPRSEVVANALGAAFGNLLVDQLGFRCVMLTDQYGTNRVVRHAIGDTANCPTQSIMRRIEEGTPEFFQSLHAGIVSYLRDRQAEQ